MMDSSLPLVRGTVSSTTVAAVDVDGAVLCGARVPNERAQMQCTPRLITPKGRTRHKKVQAQSFPDAL